MHSIVPVTTISIAVVQGEGRRLCNKSQELHSSDWLGDRTTPCARAHTHMQTCIHVAKRNTHNMDMVGALCTTPLKAVVKVLTV